VYLLVGAQTTNGSGAASVPYWALIKEAQEERSRFSCSSAWRE
jgi:hypothetical protein